MFYLARATTVALTAAAFALLNPSICRADASPAPSSSPAPSHTAQPAAPPPIPKDFDPCGGPLELLNKIGRLTTPCVFVRGEAAISAGYGSANIPANTQINFDTPFGSRNLGLSTAAHAFGYPATTVYIGVLPRAQISIVPPSFVQVNSSAAAAITGNNVVAAGATDMTFDYKQLLYVNMQKFSMVAVDVSYHAPTGSPRLRGEGPSYTIDPIAEQPLPHNFGVELALPVTNSASAVPGGGTQRGWGFAPMIIPYWQSQGGTMLAVSVQHSFNPNATPVVFSAAQLFGRHLMLSVSEGGFTYATGFTGPLAGLVHTSTQAYPSLFTVGVSYLFGHSDLPAALQQ
jgi:hypothetical protein